MIARMRLLAAALLVSFAGVGCNPISLAYFLFRGDQKAPAEVPLVPKEGKKEVTVAVLVMASNPPIEFVGIDRDLAAAVGRKIAEQTKDSKHPMRVIDRSKLDKLKKNPEYAAMSVADIGKAVGADYVVELNVVSVSLYEPGTGKLMYMGTATVEGAVYDTATGEQSAKYFVQPRMEQKPASDVLIGQYKLKLLDRLADEITWKHVPHVNDQRIASPSGL